MHAHRVQTIVPSYKHFMINIIILKLSGGFKVKGGGGRSILNLFLNCEQTACYIYLLECKKIQFFPRD